MKKIFETSFKNAEHLPIEEIVQKLLNDLPEIAKTIIENRPENDNFKVNPDDPNEHDLNWHQFGIITHTKKSYEFYQTLVQEYLKQWGISNCINEKLSEQIDGKTKAELLQISIVLHDLGKFARGFKEEGRLKPDYKGHEAKSEKLIMEDEQIRNCLQKTYALTDSQIIYIARCTALHYELGKMRDEAKKSDVGYSIAFTESEKCREVCGEIASEFSEFKEEIGILFLCDFLAKTDIIIYAKTDQEIEEQTLEIEQTIQERGLHPKLIAAIKQRPVNIANAKRYLENIITRNKLIKSNF